MLVKLTTVVNFTNILQAALKPRNAAVLSKDLSFIFGPWCVVNSAKVESKF